MHPGSLSVFSFMPDKSINCTSENIERSTDDSRGEKMTKVAKIQNQRRFSYGPQLQMQNRLQKAQKAEEEKEEKIKRIKREAYLKGPLD